MPKIINIDIDNTINDFIETFIYFHNKISEKYLRYEDITEYDLEVLTGIPRLTLETLFFKNDAFYEHLVPVENAQKVVKLLHKNGHNIRFVTAADYDVVNVRVNFVRTYFPFIDINKSLIVTSDKHHVWADLVIDDNPEHLTNVNTNCEFILYDKPWNRNFSSLNRCCNWHDVEKWLIADGYILKFNEY